MLNDGISTTNVQIQEKLMQSVKLIYIHVFIYETNKSILKKEYEKGIINFYTMN